jgi:hypothetical protein
MQRFPKEAFSVVGNLAVKRTTEGLDEGDFGEFMIQERFIKIRPKLPDNMAWATYWHEALHVACYDAGIVHDLTDKRQEAVCDAVATYLTAMMRAGMLRVVTPRRKAEE